MNKVIQAIRGMNDILPVDTSIWQTIEALLKQVAEQYGYAEIRFPVLEKSQLFKRTIGEDTDIVNKEMYTFLDKNEEGISLRPEGTAGCVRAGIQRGILYNQQQRLWYLGPMFRRERPQRGRLRQFNQFGIEYLGVANARADAEIISLANFIFSQLQVLPKLRLEINSLGSYDSRKKYNKLLGDYFKQHEAQLDPDSINRLARNNPLRILDSKNSDLSSLIANAPQVAECMDEESKKHFSQVQIYLDQLGIKYKVNPHLVRGLDYYNHTVFEWITDELGAQGTVCAGGRYDALVEWIGGKNTPAVGFALGLERLVDIYLSVRKDTLVASKLDLYLMATDEKSYLKLLQISCDLRKNLPKISIIIHQGQDKLKNQFKQADKLGATLALIVGEEELNNNKVKIKQLKNRQAEQTLVSEQELTKVIEQYLMTEQ